MTRLGNTSQTGAGELVAPLIPLSPGAGSPAGGGVAASSVTWPDTREWTSLLRYTFHDVGAADLKRARRSKEATQATIAGDGTLIPIVYGPGLLGARIAGAVAYQGQLVLLCVWCLGEIDAIEAVYVNGEAPGPGITATHYTGTGAQVADPVLVAAYAAQGIVYSDALTGVAYSVVKISPRSNAGFPRLMAKVRGMKVATSDGGAPTYSDNPAYALADFVTSTAYGMGRSVDWATVATTASACDVMVGSPAEKKRLIALTIDVAQPCESWLNILRDYAGCWALPEGPSYQFVPDAAAASVKSFTTADIAAGTLKLVKKGTLTSPTVVEVVYTDTSAIPWRDNVVSVAAEGVAAGTTPRRVTRLQKPGITRYSEAYRYAIERLNDALLNDLSVAFTAFDDALELQVGDVIDVTHPIGLTAKAFRIQTIAAVEPGRWAITAREYDPAKYSTTVVASPSVVDTSLPSPSVVTAPTGLAVAEDVFVVQTGRYGSRLVVTWTGPTQSDYVFLTSFTLAVSDGTNVSTWELPVDATEFTTPALPEGLLYTVSLRARSELAESAAAIVTIRNDGKLALPSDVPSISAYSVNGETRVSWEPATDLDLTSYELRWSAQSGTWEDATALAFVAAPETRFATTLVPAGDRRVWIKAHDSVRTEAYPNGQESANAAYVDLTVVASNTSASVEYELAEGTLTNMIAHPAGGWITSVAGDTFAALFGSALSTYGNALATYHGSAISSIVSATIDGDASELCTVSVDPDYADLSGTGQVYIEHKVASGDSWTRVNASVAVVTARYFRAGVEWTTTETGRVYSLGTLVKTVDSTEAFVRDTVLNDPAAWLTI